MQKFLPCLLLAGLLLFNLDLSAQGDRQATLDQIAAKLVNSLQSNKEMIYLHIDKPFHLAGTTVWFRAYLLNQQTQLPSTQSRLVYVDLLDEELKSIDQIVLYARDLELGGGIKLPAKVKEGNYYIRAYTNLVSPDAPESFIAPIYIINADQGGANVKPIRKWKAAPSEVNSVRFYPEGGNLINGVDCVVGVRATDASGKPAAINGIIKDNRDSVVANFQTLVNGLGKFVFNPYKNRKYRAIVKNAGQETTIELPALSNTAYQLALIKQDSQKISLRVALSDPLYEKKAGSYLLAVSRGRVAFASIGSGMYKVDIPVSNFPEGIADFYLYDEQQNEVSRRRVWVNNNDIRFDVKPNKTQYYPRSTAMLDISLTDKSGKPLAGVLSVSVTDNGILNPSSQLPAITDYNFINKSGVTNSSCVFNNVSDLSQDIADLILMTAADKSASIASPGKSLDSILSIKGKLFYKNSPLVNESISLIAPQQPNLFRSDTTDASGSFSFNNLNYFDSTQFYIQLTHQKIDALDLTLKLDPSSIPASVEPTSLVNDCKQEDQLNAGVQMFKKNNIDSFLIGNTREWLSSITIKGRKTPEDKYGKRNKFSHVITREQLSKMEQSTTANAVKMIPGVIMVSGNLTIRGGIPSFDNAGILDGNIEPMVVVDGVPAVTAGGVVNYLNSIPPNQIDYIEVLTGGEAAQYGTRAGNGVILIKTGQPQYFSSGIKNSITIYPKGYHVSPDFYMPDYSNEKIKEAEFKDNRSTIYWNGSVWTDKNGKATVQFYTADAKTTYTVTVMGITSKGDLVMKQIVVGRN